MNYIWIDNNCSHTDSVDRQTVETIIDENSLAAEVV